jgi:hypothetical protein
MNTVCGVRNNTEKPYVILDAKTSSACSTVPADVFVGDKTLADGKGCAINITGTEKNKR